MSEKITENNIADFCGNDHRVRKFGDAIREVCDSTSGCTFASMIGVLEIVKRDLIEEMIMDSHLRDS